MEKNNNDFTEVYKGITRLVKTKENDGDAWFAVIGKMIVSRGTFKTKEDCLKDLETPDYEQVCKIALAIVTALKDYKPKKVKEV
jgi:hypothetical protein